MVRKTSKYFVGEELHEILAALKNIQKINTMKEETWR
jgi:hypothetical protein